MSRLVILIISGLLSLQSISCELTDEYKELQDALREKTKTSYGLCASSVEWVQHWYMYDQCIKNNDAANYSFGCGDFVEKNKEKYKSVSVGTEICDSHKEGTALYQRVLDNAAKHLKVQKCKET